MPTLYYDLINDELDDDDLDDEYLYEKDNYVDLEDVDPNVDEDDVFCLQCKEIVEDGVQCSFCGWIVEIVKPFEGGIAL